MSPSSVKIKRFRFADAIATSPPGESGIRTFARCCASVVDLYGSIRPDAVIVGDDILVSLCAALQLALQGHSSVIVPDKLSKAHWLSQDAAEQFDLETTSWNREVEAIIADRFFGRISAGSFGRTISALAAACKRSGLVQILSGGQLQSDAATCRGEAGRHILFPVSTSHPKCEGLSPLWALVERTVPRVCFGYRVVEFVTTKKVILTSCASPLIDPTSVKAVFVGQMRANRSDDDECMARRNDIQSVFTLSI